MINVDDMNNPAVRKILKQIIEKLDELDCDDYFGTEGWKHMFGIEY